MQPKPVIPVPGYPDIPRPPDFVIDVNTPRGGVAKEGNLEGRVVKEKKVKKEKHHHVHHHHHHHHHQEQQAEVINQINVAFTPPEPLAQPVVLVAANNQQNEEAEFVRNERPPRPRVDIYCCAGDCCDCGSSSEGCCVVVSICCGVLLATACTVAFVFMIVYGAIRLHNADDNHDKNVGKALVIVGSVMLGIGLIKGCCSLICNSSRN